MGELFQTVPEMRCEFLDLKAALNQSERRWSVRLGFIHKDRTTSPLDVLPYAKLPEISLSIVFRVGIPQLPAQGRCVIVARCQPSAHPVRSALAQNPPVLVVPVHIADQASSTR